MMRKEKNARKRGGILMPAVLFLLFIVYIFPFFLILINSFKAKTDVVKEPLRMIGAHGFAYTNYLEAIEKMNFWRSFGNSTMITVVSVVLIVFFSSTAAYLFVRTDWKFCTAVFALMIASMVIPFQVLMIPIVSIYGAGFHILNSRITLIFMHVGFGVSMGTFLFHGAIKSTVPLELEEAARIDGCGKIRTFGSIVFPLLKPMCATLIVIDALAVWNDYLLPSLVLGKKELYTLPIAARVFHGTYSSDYGLMMAGLILSVIPVLALYLVLQRYIIEGVVTGAVKG